MDFTKIYINGEWITPDTKEFIEVENPSDKSIIERVPRCNEADTNRAIDSAKTAFLKWSETSLEYRIDLVTKFIEELEKQIDVMADIVAKELGSPVDFARNIHIVNYIEDGKNYIKVAKEYEYEEKFDGYIVRSEPVGVVGAITPWNYPFGQITKKIFPALLGGNTVVLKPSQMTPLVAYYLTNAIDKAGFPEGVFNLVTGKGSEVGNVMAKHKDIDLISFTGSTSGGIEVGKIGLSDVKTLALELGGKSAAIVLEGVDLEESFKILAGSIFANTGQSCSALSRLLVPRKIAGEVEAFLLGKMKDITYGSADENKFMGPLSSQKQWDKVVEYLNIGLGEGAKLLYGEVPKNHDTGYYIGPVIFKNVTNDMRIAREEIFGPVLSIIEYDTLEEAIEIANDNKYGLSGAVFGPNDLAQKVARRMRTGTVIINNGARTQAAPFGGYKQSGIGREGGRFGLEEYLEVKTIFS